MTAWQASPVRGELWWRRADGGKPVLCYAVTQPLGAMGAHEVSRSIWYSTAPCDGVTWARCVPPVDAPQTDPPPQCTTHHYAGCACHEARRDAEVTALRAQIHRIRAAVADLPRHLGASWWGQQLSRAIGGEHE